MSGCIRCHGPLDHKGNCPICDQMSASKYCKDPDNCEYGDCPTAFCDRRKSASKTPLTDLVKKRFNPYSSFDFEYVTLKDCRAIEERLTDAIEVLRKADDDIRELLQIAKYNLWGQIPTGDILEPPIPPLLVHTKGIEQSEALRKLINETIVKSSKPI